MLASKEMPPLVVVGDIWRAKSLKGRLIEVSHCKVGRKLGHYFSSPTLP